MRKLAIIVIMMISVSSVCHADHSLIREGDNYRVIIDKCLQVDVAELLIPAVVVCPGSRVIWADNAPKEAYFEPFTYVGIDGCDILLRQDPGPLLRIPIRGVFSRYGIFDLRGVRFYLKIVYPDMIKIAVRSPHWCSRDHWARREKISAPVCNTPKIMKPRGTEVGHKTKRGDGR